AEFRRTGHITGLLLLVSESMVPVLLIVRRKASVVDRSVPGTLTTIISIAAPFFVRAGDVAGLMPDPVTASISIAGLAVIIAGKLTLGRSFGLVPANRGVVDGGPYAVVRHPIYAGYLVTHAAFVLAHPTGWNLAILITADVSLVVRALFEERVLV